ncbi:unnamed protein product, partial [Prorocentrum cordatum]
MRPGLPSPPPRAWSGALLRLGARGRQRHHAEQGAAPGGHRGARPLLRASALAATPALAVIALAALVAAPAPGSLPGLEAAPPGDAGGTWRPSAGEDADDASLLQKAAPSLAAPLATAPPAVAPAATPLEQPRAGPTAGGASPLGLADRLAPVVLLARSAAARAAGALGILHRDPDWKGMETKGLGDLEGGMKGLEKQNPIVLMVGAAILAFSMACCLSHLCSYSRSSEGGPF